MDGIHDLGGMHGFGPVRPEKDEPVFHEAWEGRVLAMNVTLRAQRLYNIDESRHGIERMAPARYLASSYYERWLATIETNLIEKGILTGQEIDAKTRFFEERPDASPPHRVNPALAEETLASIKRSGNMAQEGAPPRFEVGDRVVARVEHPKGHTRLPRYVRGKHGVIIRLHGLASFPDTNAHGLGPHPQALYSVCFAARELWGDDADPVERLYIDMWDSYLEPA